MRQFSREVPAKEIGQGRNKERFVDAAVCKTIVKKTLPRSAWSVAEPSTRRRYLEDSLGAVCCAWHSAGARASSARRPVSAEVVEAVFVREVEGWNNPCFESRALPAPVGDGRRTTSGKWCGGASRFSCEFDETSTNMSREMFNKLRIIGQIDRKFILVICEARQSRHDAKDSSRYDGDVTMLAVDQHAASERFLYERYMKWACVTHMKSFTLPCLQKVRVSCSQRRAAEDYRKDVQRWGWRIDIPMYDDGVIEVTGVPHVMSSTKGIIVGNAELICLHLDAILNGAGTTCVPIPIEKAIASAACHTAVRFGDVLSKVQCESLVQSLAGCDNPFTCAHGRPSIVPLVILKNQISN